MSEWKRMEDELPREEVDVLVRTDQDSWYKARRKPGDFWRTSNGLELHHVTHWLAVPPIPPQRKMVQAEFCDDEGGGHLVYNGRIYYPSEE